MYLKFFAELDDKKTRLVSAEVYDFYLLSNVEMRNSKRSQTLRFGDERADGDTQILMLSATKIAFTQKFKRIRSQQPHEFIRALTLTDNKTLTVEELHYIEGELGIIKTWSLKKS